MTIAQMRRDVGLTQEKCAEYLKIPLRTYKRYEADESKLNPIKLQYVSEGLKRYGLIDEEHGKLSIDRIRDICRGILASHHVEYCYLFGSYAKGTATEKSDVDLLVSVPIDGIGFYELVETLREKLKKKVDVLDTAQLMKNPMLAEEILHYGVKIYG